MCLILERILTIPELHLLRQLRYRSVDQLLGQLFVFVWRLWNFLLFAAFQRFLGFGLSLELLLFLYLVRLSLSRIGLLMVLLKQILIYFIYKLLIRVHQHLIIILITHILHWIISLQLCLGIYILCILGHGVHIDLLLCHQRIEGILELLHHYVVLLSVHHVTIELVLLLEHLHFLQLAFCHIISWHLIHHWHRYSKLVDRLVHVFITSHSLWVCLEEVVHILVQH